MTRCTAPVRGHRTASAAADCPACSGRRRYGGYSSYSNYNIRGQWNIFTKSCGIKTKARLD